MKKHDNRPRIALTNFGAEVADFEAHVMRITIVLTGMVALGVGLSGLTATAPWMAAVFIASAFTAATLAFNNPVR
jgi:hypothetical protein